MSADTIVACATAQGRAGVAIIRLSGAKAYAIAESMVGQALTPRHAHYLNFYDAEKNVLDKGIVLYFATPHSLTGEDVVELHCHGGPISVDRLQARCCQLGARMAQAGEFLKRAFLNDKIDLAQAEATADLINAKSMAAHRSALRSLQGDFSEAVHALVTQFIDCRKQVEAAIDFAEDDIPQLANARLAEAIDAIKQGISQLMAQASQGVLLRDGIKIAIVGKTNAGKSSLLNKLCGEETAIVTSIAGTTRDVLRETISLDGLPVHISDTAGIRASEDIVEQEGIKRSYREIEQVDGLLYVQDACLPLAIDEIIKKTIQPDNIIVVFNKMDLLEKTMRTPKTTYPSVTLSAKTGEGMAALKAKLKKMVGYHQSEEGHFMARQRHLQALKQAEERLTYALSLLNKAALLELVAEELTIAQQALAAITGQFTADDLLGEIFASFCIGK